MDAAEIAAVDLAANAVSGTHANVLSYQRISLLCSPKQVVRSQGIIDSYVALRVRTKTCPPASSFYSSSSLSCCRCSAGSGFGEGVGSVDSFISSVVVEVVVLLAAKDSIIGLR